MKRSSTVIIPMLVSMFACGTNGPDSPECSTSHCDSSSGAEAYVGVAFDVTVDPSTKLVVGTTVAKVKAGSVPLGSLSLILDEGLVANSATIGGVPATVTNAIASPYRVVTITPTQPIPAGTTATASLSYGGTLVCAAPVALQGPCDVVPGGMSRFSPGSIFPAFATSDLATQRAPHTIVLRTPVGAEVVASATRTDDRVIGGHRVTTWQADNAPLLAPTAVVGTFATVSLVGAPRPVVFHHAPGDDAWVERLRSWIPKAIPFVESTIGRALPCEELHLVKWPDTFTDAGYTTNCLISLRDLHEQSGELLFEEAWVHEIAHLWWGVGVAPVDLPVQKVATEGLAQYTMWQYRYAQQVQGDAAIDRDVQLALRSREVGLMLRYVTPAAAATPVVAHSPSAAVSLDPHGFFETFTWEYLKTTATVDLLELLVGQDQFWAGVRRYHDACVWGRCTIDDFKAALAFAAGQNLDRFFSEWLSGTPYPAITVAFTTTPGATAGAEMVDVTLTTQSPVATPLELWLELANGQRVRHRVTVTAPSTRTRVHVDAPVRSVRPNPRHDALAFIDSVVPGDLDFDGVATLADRAHCTTLVGKRVTVRFPAGGGESFVGLDLEFDPRCDLDADGAITAGDVAAIPAPD